MTLKLEIGKIYRRRDGDETGPLEENDSKEYPFFDPSHGETYTPEGDYFEDGTHCAKDLVELVASGVQDPPKADAIEYLVLPHGKYLRHTLAEAKEAAIEAGNGTLVVKLVGAVQTKTTFETFD